MGGPRRIRSDPIRSVPLSGQQQVTGRSSKAHRRSGRIVSYRIESPRPSRVESSDRWGRWFGRHGVGGVVAVVIIELDVSEGEGPTPKCECDWTSECHRCHVTVIRPLGNGVGDTGRQGQAW